MFSFTAAVFFFIGGACFGFGIMIPMLPKKDEKK